MSTTIYDGFRLRPGTDPFDFADAVRAHATTLSAHIVENETLVRATAIADARLVGLPTCSGTSPVVAAGRDIMDEWRTEHARRCLSTGELRVWIGRDPQTRLYYGVPQAVDAQMFDAVRQVDAGWQSYGYWNNADRPHDVPDSSWQEREETWLRVLPGAGVLADSMLSFEVLAPWPIINREDWSDLDPSGDDALACHRGIPTRAARARRIAHHLIAGRLCQDLGSGEEIIRLAMKACWGAGTPVGVASLIEPVLPRVSEAYLTTTVHQIHVDGLSEAVQAAARELEETL